MIRAIDLARRLCPGAHPTYLTAFEAADGELAAAGITTPIRLAHFLAQCFHETGGLTVLVENMRYTTPAALQRAWKSRYPATKAYLRKPVELAIFVYGGRMGNAPAPSDDGYRYRGRGILQTTGRAAYRKYGQRCGVDFEGNPDLVIDPLHMLKPALAEWTDGRCNEKADRNAIVEITFKINGGDNGLKDRIGWFDQIWRIVGQGASWEAAASDPDIAGVQEQLNRAGFDLVVDGRKGPKTVEAIRAFQASAKIPVTGIADPVTRAALGARLAELDAPKPVLPASADKPAIENATELGGGLTVGGGTADQVLNQAQQVSGIAAYVPALKYVAAALIVVGVCLVLYGIGSAWWRKRQAEKRGAPA